MIDDLDDAAAIGDALLIVRAFDAKQRAITDARSHTPRGVALRVNSDLRGLAALRLVPFRRRRNQLAIGISASNISQDGRGKGCGLGNCLAAFDDPALVGKLAQQALQLCAVGVLQAELARDFLCPDVSGIPSDESDDGVPGRKAMVMPLLHLS